MEEYHSGPRTIRRARRAGTATTEPHTPPLPLPGAVCHIPLTREYTATVDAAGYPLVTQFTWHVETSYSIRVPSPRQRGGRTPMIKAGCDHVLGAPHWRPTEGWAAWRSGFQRRSWPGSAGSPWCRRVPPVSWPRVITFWWRPSQVHNLISTTAPMP